MSEDTVLLRDTPEDRERVNRAIRDVIGNLPPQGFVYGTEAFVDAIIAALARGEIGVEAPPEKPE